MGNFIRTIQGFINYNKEYSNKEFQLTRRLIDLFDENLLNKMIRIVEEVEKMKNIHSQIKSESEKEYSELKYTLLDEYEKMYKKYVKEIENHKDFIVMKYYEKTGKNLFDDLETIERYISNSKYYSSEFPGIPKIISFLKSSRTKSNIDDLIRGV